jgi:membrane protease YdiL (CAAX protease family)
MRILGYRPRQVGLTSGFTPVQLGVGLTGLAFGILEYPILGPEPAITRFTWQAVWLPALIFMATTGFVEEFMFRGVMQQSAVQALGGWEVVYVSLVFALLSMGFFSWVDVVFVLVVALFFGWVVKRTGSLLGVALSQGITNVVVYLIARFLLG